MSNKPLPIGIDDFEKIITGGYYYVDKSWFIKELLDKKGEVNLFTRPRRFGKTLNLSMLRYYFEKTEEREKNESYAGLFEGLKIMQAGEKYTSQMGQYPVIMLTLKSAKQPDFEMAYASLVDDIGREYDRHSYVLDSECIKEADKEKFLAIRDRKGERIDYAKSLLFLSECLTRYHGKNTIILIDEYDVPLENAFYSGFYDEMIGFIRSLFESALKTNPYLAFSVITGCLRISKESIFTRLSVQENGPVDHSIAGLNNPHVISILNEDYGEHFGFVESEVKDMLTFYDRENNMSTMKAWYDGYIFGNEEVYNPWSVINYAYDLRNNPNAFPTASWSNTSSNSIVKDLIYKADESVQEEIEILVNGGNIEKQIHEDITYDMIYNNEDNLWNFLFFTGYLKASAKRMEMDAIYVTFSLPNREVRSIYVNMIMTWIRDRAKGENLQVLYTSMLDGDRENFEQEMTRQLQRTISYMDGKEAFYHGWLVGILGNIKWRVKSNREAGDGRYDILVRNTDTRKTPIVLELKVSETRKELNSWADDALEQIATKHYDADLYEDGYTEVIHYGVAFYRKQVRVKMGRKKLEM